VGETDTIDRRIDVALASYRCIAACIDARRLSRKREVSIANDKEEGEIIVTKS